MRNPERIDGFTKELNRVWKTYYSDWRFGQFMMNFFEYIMKVSRIDPFFLEEHQTLTYLKEFCGEENNIIERSN